MADPAENVSGADRLNIRQWNEDATETEREATVDQIAAAVIRSLVFRFNPIAEEIEATGDSRATATPITRPRAIVTATEAGQGVVLTGAEAEIILLGTIDVLVYPPEGAQIGTTGAIDAPTTMLAGDPPVRFIPVNSTLYV